MATPHAMFVASRPVHVSSYPCRPHTKRLSTKMVASFAPPSCPLPGSSGLTASPPAPATTASTASPLQQAAAQQQRGTAVVTTAMVS